MQQSGGKSAAVRGDIEGLRAVSILAVVLYHAVGVLLPGGFIGVDVFFVISGFVITASLMRRVGRSGSVSILDFYVRRAKRILPALTTFLVVMLPGVLILGSAYELGRSVDTAAASAGFVANMQLLWEGAPSYFATSARENAFLHTWSLAVEEQFYFVFPVAVAGCLAWARRRRSAEAGPRTMLRMMLAGLAVSFALMVVVASADQQAAFYLAPTRAWEFLAGAALALVPSVAGRWATPMRGVGLAMILASTVIFDSGTAWPSPATLLPVVGAVLVMGAGPGAGRLARLLDNRVMRRIGELSYGWYLWHWPAIVLGEQSYPNSNRVALLAAVVAIVPAALSLRLIENPIRFSDLKKPKPVLSAAAVSVAGLIVLSLVVIPVVDRALPGSEDDIIAEADLQFIQDTATCGGDAPIHPELCTSFSGEGSPTARLVGDSEAAQLAIPFHRAMQELGMNGVLSTKLSCSFLPGLSVRNLAGEPVSGCDDHNARLLAELLERPVDVIVMSGHLGQVLAAADLVDVATGRSTPPERKGAVLVDTMTDVVSQLQLAGTHVILVRRPPPVAEFAVYDCARWRWILDASTCSTSSPLATALERRASDDDIIDAVIARTGASVVDPGPITCGGDVCRSYRDAVWIYGDSAHLTGQFVGELSPLIVEAVANVAGGSVG